MPVDIHVGPPVLNLAKAGATPSLLVVRGDQITANTKPTGTATSNGLEFTVKKVSGKAGRLVLVLYYKGPATGGVVRPMGDPDVGTVTIPLADPPVVVETPVELNNDPPPAP